MNYFIFVLAYLIGSVPFGLVVGKLFYGVDIREHGSGNLGGTNTFRTLGKKAGFIVTIGDILKGTLAASLPLLFHHQELNPLFVGLFAVIGHMYPIFAGFRGGKAVATSAGLLLFQSPLLFLILLIFFLGCLFTTKYVSLSSMLTAIVSMIGAWIEGDKILFYILTIITIFIVYRHRANIKRIMNGTESKANIKLFKK